MIPHPLLLLQVLLATVENAEAKRIMPVQSLLLQVLLATVEELVFSRKIPGVSPIQMFVIILAVPEATSNT